MGENAIDKTEGYAPVLPKRPAVTVLIPFDIGNSYAFFSEGAEDAKIKMLQQWKALFPESSKSGAWNLEQFPRPFRKPLNFTARLLFTSGSELLNDALQGLPWLGRNHFGIEIIFFQLGVAILVLRASLEVGLKEAMDSVGSPQARDTLRAAVAPLVVEGARSYKEVLDAAADPNGMGLVHKLKVKREVNLAKIKYPYPIFFVDGGDAVNDLLATKNKYSTVTYAGDYVSANVIVGWGESLVGETTVDFMRTIEVDFLLAMVSWYALITMNRHSSFHLLQALADMGSGKRMVRKKEVTDLRFTYMDAANSLYPVLWTTQQRDLILIETIHATWSSERLWKNVAAQTELLTLHHGQLEEEDKETTDRLIELIGLIVASLVFPSALADTLEQLPESALSKHARFLMVLLGTLAFILAIFTTWIILKPDRRKRQPFEALLRKLEELHQYDTEGFSERQ